MQPFVVFVFHLDPQKQLENSTTTHEFLQSSLSFNNFKANLHIQSKGYVASNSRFTIFPLPNELYEFPMSYISLYKHNSILGDELGAKIDTSTKTDRLTSWKKDPNILGTIWCSRIKK